MTNTDVKTSRRSTLLNVMFISGLAVAGALILLWLPMSLYIATTMDATLLGRTIAANNLYAVIGEYPLILALPILYAIVVQRRRGLLAVIVAIMWCANVAVVIVAGACLIDVYGTDKEVGDWYELESDRRLINAIIENDTSYVESHIRSGKRIIFFGERGVNPMYVAVHMDRWSIAKAFHNAGCDIRIRPPGGNFYALSRLFRSSQGQDNENRMEFLRMLMKTGIKPDKIVDRDSLLDDAVAVRDVSALREMLPFADINGDGKSTILQLVLHAIDQSSWTCGELLLPYLDVSDVPEAIAAAENQKDILAPNSSQPTPRELFIAKLRSLR